MKFHSPLEIILRLQIRSLAASFFLIHSPCLTLFPLITKKSQRSGKIPGLNSSNAAIFTVIRVLNK